MRSQPLPQGRQGHEGGVPRGWAGAGWCRRVGGWDLSKQRGWDQECRGQAGGRRLAGSQVLGPLLASTHLGLMRALFQELLESFQP